MIKLKWRAWLAPAGLAMAIFAISFVSRNASAQNAAPGRDLHQTYELAPNGEISVINASGNIRVTTWNENRVKVDAVKHGRSEEVLSHIQIQVTAKPERLEIQTIFPSSWRGRWNDASVEYDLKVPRSAVLNSLSATSGDIAVTGPVARVTARSTSGSLTVQDVGAAAYLTATSGDIKAERIKGELKIISTSGNVVVNEVGSRLSVQCTSGNVSAVDVRDDATAGATSGAVRLERIGGRAIARSLSGVVTVNDAGGDVQAESISDNVTVSQVKGRVTATSVSGNIAVQQVEEGVRAGSVSGSVQINDVKGRIEVNTTSDAIILNRVDSKDILAKSTSGGVRFDGKFYDDGHYEFESFSGDVVLTLPPESNFTLSTKSHSGSVNTEFPLQLGTGNRPGGRGYLGGTVGKGGAEVRAATFSGSVYIKKK